MEMKEKEVFEQHAVCARCHKEVVLRAEPEASATDVVMEFFSLGQLCGDCLKKEEGAKS